MDHCYINIVFGYSAFSPKVIEIFNPLFRNFSAQTKKISSVVIAAITTVATVYYGPTRPLSNCFLAIVINSLVYQLFEPYFFKINMSPFLKNIGTYPLGIFALIYFYPHNLRNFKIGETFLLFVIGSIFKEILTDGFKEKYGEKSSETIKKLTAIGLTLGIAYNLHDHTIEHTIKHCFDRSIEYLDPSIGPYLNNFYKFLLFSRINLEEYFHKLIL